MHNTPVVSSCITTEKYSQESKTVILIENKLTFIAADMPFYGSKHLYR